MLIFQGQFGPVSFSPMPDGNLNYDDLMNATFEVYGFFDITLSCTFTSLFIKPPAVELHIHFPFY